MNQFNFDSSTTSDQKRLVRGEQLLMARTILRARDNLHHAKWRVLMLPGGSPRAEITAIKELMPKAHITAVDKESLCLEAAIEAGADEVIQCDLTQVSRAPEGQGKKLLPEPLRGQSFDLLNLDFCFSVNSLDNGLFTAYRRSALSPHGVVILTFSYGREVVEFFMETLREWEHGEVVGRRGENTVARLREAGVPDGLIGRFCCIFTPSEIEQLRSVVLYKGNRMPMCSALYQHRGSGRLRFFQTEPGDFELAACYPDAMNLYDCPKERIESLRRRFAALKASITRSEKSFVPKSVPEQSQLLLSD